MIDLYKTAIRFCAECLAWKGARLMAEELLLTITDEDRQEVFDPALIESLQARVEQFLGKRFWMQVNRDFTNLFVWTVSIGQQDLHQKSSSWEHAVASGPDLATAMLEACLLAKSMDKRAE